MTRDEAVEAIQRRLGFYTKKDTEIQAEINIAQDAMEREGVKMLDGKGTFRPWFLVGEMFDAVTTIADERVAFPTGFLGEVEDAALWLIDPDADSDTAPIELSKDSLDFLTQNFPGTGQPSTYTMLGTYFRLKPVPNAAYPLKIITYVADTVLSTNITNRWLTYAPRVLWSKAGLEISIALRDAAAMKHFGSVFAESSTALFSTTEERMHTNRRYVMGGND